MSPNILLVEDNPADARLVQEALVERALDAALFWMPSGEQALAFLRHDAAQSAALMPDLVLLDLNLPGLSGHEVLAAIKQDPSLLHIPVVVLTSSSAPADVRAAYRAHANAYLVKPDDFDDFLALVADLHHHWLQAVLLPSRVA